MSARSRQGSGRVNRARSRRGARFEANAPVPSEISRESDPERGRIPRPVATWFEESLALRGDSPGNLSSKRVKAPPGRSGSRHGRRNTVGVVPRRSNPLLEETSMRLVSARIVAVVVAGLVPAVAFAGAPARIRGRSSSATSASRDRPRAAPAIQRWTTRAASSRTGSRIPASLDLLKRPVLHGTLTVVADERSRRQRLLAGNPVINAVLEIKLKGKTYFFAKSFQSSTPGNWPDRRLERADLGGGDQAPQGHLADSSTPSSPWGRSRVRSDDMVEEVWPGLFDLTGRVPLIVEALPPSSKPSSPISTPTRTWDAGRPSEGAHQYAAPVV